MVFMIIRYNDCTIIIYSTDDSVEQKTQIVLRREQYILQGEGPPEQISTKNKLSHILI